MGLFFRKIIFVHIVLILGLIASFALADQKIKDIIVEGNKRVEAETILSYLSFHKNGNYDDDLHDESLKKLNNTGLFSEVSIENQGGIIKVFVQENPLVNIIAFEGNKLIQDKDLSNDLILKTRMVFSKGKLQSDVNRIISLYNKEGRFGVKVDPKIIKLDENRINLVFEIDEGPKTLIKRIEFVGNHVFRDFKLRSVINSKEEAWWRFLSSGDKYDADKLDYDKEVLKEFYYSNGYADFKIISVTTDLSPNKDGFYITFVIEEGKKYKFGKINVISHIENIEPSEFLEAINFSEGEVFNVKKIEKSTSQITKKLTNLGYAFVKVEPQYKRNYEEHIVDVDYQIDKTRKIYIDRIDITGNVRTLDSVIRREFRFNEQDPYNAEKLKRSEARIRDLDFFDKVKVSTIKTATPDKVNVNVDVEEKSTGDINFGAGYSTTDGPLGRIGVKEINLLGTGHELGVMYEKAQRRTNYNLSYTNPKLYDRDLAVGFDLFNTSQDYKTASSYSTETIGGKLRMGYNLSEYLTHNISYRFTETDVKVKPNASRSIRDQAGTAATSALSHNIIYDSRNSRLFPSSGFFVKFNEELAGLGGDSRFFNNEIKAAYYLPLWEEKNVFVKFSLSGGHIFGDSRSDNKGIRIFERYFLGGDDLRGFKTSGIGPRDPADNMDALGGNSYYLGNIELSFPLGFPEEFDISGAAFVDAGSLFGLDDETPGILGKKGSLRVSSGVGIVWITRLGPIRFDWAKPLVKEKFDRTQSFRFSFSTGF